VLKLNKPDDNHLPTWFENAESRFPSASVSSEEDWFNLFRDALSDDKANAWGSFHYTRCCFGLSNSPQSMQRLTDWLTSDLDNVQGYVDDFLAFSATPEEHESHIRQLIPKVPWCWSKNQSNKDRLRLLRSYILRLSHQWRWHKAPAWKTRGHQKLSQTNCSKMSEIILGCSQILQTGDTKFCGHCCTTEQTSAKEETMLCSSDFFQGGEWCVHKS